MNKFNEYKIQTRNSETNRNTHTHMDRHDNSLDQRT
jgi:hypothetical protein